MWQTSSHLAVLWVAIPAVTEDARIVCSAAIVVLWGLFKMKEPSETGNHPVGKLEIPTLIQKEFGEKFPGKLWHYDNCIYIRYVCQLKKTRFGLPLAVLWLS